MNASNAESNAAATVAARELVVERVFDAPREVVFRAWTDPAQLAQWWGPARFTNPTCEFEARRGGAILIDMRAPDGTVYRMRGTVQEIEPPTHLVFSAVPVDADDNPLFETLNRVTLTEERGKTRMRIAVSVVQAGPHAEQYLAGMEQGWNQSLERFEAFVPKANEIVAARFFDAPREQVWKLWTDQHHVAQWWGPNGFTTTIETMDVRPGGEWNFVMHGPDGRDYINKNVYGEVAEPERLTYDHLSGPLFHAEVTFNETNGKTSIVMRMQFATAELRNQVAEQAGAVEGLQQTLGRLAEELLNRDFVITRAFDAARELVWKAWTETERLAQWFGPKGTKLVVVKNDMRPGGTFHYGNQMPDGKIIWGVWEYREIVPPEKLVVVTWFSDEEGGKQRHPFAPKWPLTKLSTVTFAEHGGKTTVTIRWSPIDASEEEFEAFEASLAGVRGGWGGTFEQLAAYLANAQ